MMAPESRLLSGGCHPQKVAPAGPDLKPLRECLESLIQGFSACLPNQPPTVPVEITARLLLLSAWRHTGMMKLSPEASVAEHLLEIPKILTRHYGLSPEAVPWLSQPFGDAPDIEDPAFLAQWHEGCSLLEDYHPLQDADPLGPVYEASLAMNGRKRQGQFYTPPAVMAFLNARTGIPKHLGPGSPCKIYDPATGSGGFLLTAAQSWIREANPAEAQAIRDTLLQSLYGSEQDESACRITIINLLLLLTPLVQTIQQETPNPGTFRILHKDSLSLLHTPSQTKQTENPDAPLTHFLHQPEIVDFCIGNPPYIGEKGHKELFRETLERYPQWKPYYQGRMDYLYFFFILGISKLKPGGRLGFLTTRYWLTADSADILRQEILNTCRILEIIDCSAVNLFEQAGGQHNLMVVLEKCPDPKIRQRHHPKWITLKKPPRGLPGLFEMAAATPSKVHGWLDAETLENPWVSVQRAVSPQEELRRSSSPMAPQVWRRQTRPMEEQILEKIRAHGTPLGQLFEDQQGVISGADKVTEQNRRWLTQANDSRVGDGIFCLSPQELKTLNVPDAEAAYIKPFFKNSHILPFAVRCDAAQAESLLYLSRDVPPELIPTLIGHLERYREILARKRECVQGKLPWYSLHWPRKQALLEAESIVTPRRAAYNRFAISPRGWYENSDITILVLKPGSSGTLPYYLGLLNSSLLDFWMAHHGKPKGAMREYYATPLQQVPLALPQPDSYDTLCQQVEQCRQLQEARETNGLGKARQRLDQMVAEIYGLSDSEQAYLYNWKPS